MKIRVPAKKRSAGLRCYHRRARMFRRLGLTTHGEWRARTPNYHTPTQRLAARRRQLRDYMRRRFQKFASAGLTTRGTPRKYKSWPQLRGLSNQPSRYQLARYHALKEQGEHAAASSLLQKFNAGQVSTTARLKGKR